jgi:hypothetical protein
MILKSNILGIIKANGNNKCSFNTNINKMTEVEKVIKEAQKDAAEKLRLFSVSGSLRPVLLLASYCGEDNPNCTNIKPCDECLKMCNIAFVEDKSIDINKVVCGFDFIEDYR